MLLKWAQTILIKLKLHCDRQSVSKSWCRAPSGAHDQIFITVWQLRSCFSVTPSVREDGFVLFICCWPLQLSLSRVRVPWDWRPYFTVSDLRLPFSSPRTTRRVTAAGPLYIASARSAQTTQLPTALLLRVCLLQPLPSNDRCLQNHYLGMAIA
jgi:hypothetical protein